MPPAHPHLHWLPHLPKNATWKIKLPQTPSQAALGPGRLSLLASLPSAHSQQEFKLSPVGIPHTMIKFEVMILFPKQISILSGLNRLGLTQWTKLNSSLQSPESQPS